MIRPVASISCTSWKDTENVELVPLTPLTVMVTEGEVEFVTTVMGNGSINNKKY